MPPDAERRLLQRTDRQQGRFSLADADACGLPRSTLYGRVRSGRYRNPLPRVFALAGATDDEHGRITEALLFAGPGALVSHHSAARLLGGRDVDDAGCTHIIVADRLLDSRGHVRVHETGILPAHHRVVAAGRPATSPARTSCDLADHLAFAQVRRFVTTMVRTGRMSSATLGTCADELGPFNGKRVIHTVLEELDPLTADTREELERLYLRVTRPAGVAPTRMNHWVTDVYGERRCLDAVYLPERVPVELDGRRWHGLVTDLHDDLRRENAVKLVGGWRDFLRFTWWDLKQRPDEVVHEVRVALALARGETPPPAPDVRG